MADKLRLIATGVLTVVTVLTAGSFTPAQAVIQSAQPPAASGSLMELPGSTPAPAPAAAPVPAPTAPPPATPAPETAPGLQPPAAQLPIAAPAPAAVLTLPQPGLQPSAPVAAAPAPSAEPVADAKPLQPKDIADISEKNPDLLLVPTHAGSTSLMFNKADMDVLAPFIEVYDNTVVARKEAVTGNGGDDLTSLLQSLKSHEDNNSQAAVPQQLPNIYLSSIVYYSPSHWSVWINGRKLINPNNLPNNEFYVSRLSRSEVELVWKPPVMLDMATMWGQMTDKGKNPLPHIAVDTAKGTVTLNMHTNQTFLPRSLAIHEGYIKSETSQVSHVATPANTVSPNPGPANANLSISPPGTR